MRAFIVRFAVMLALYLPLLVSNGVHAAESAQASTRADHDFTPEITQAQALLGKQIAGSSRTAKQKTLAYNVLLAVKKQGGDIELVRMTPDGKNDAGFDITWSRANGVNTPYRVTREAGITYAVLAIRRTISESTGFHEVVYTPYTESIDTPMMRTLGMQYLQQTLTLAELELYELGVVSRAVPKHPVGKIVSSDVALALSVIEHIDPSRLQNTTIDSLVSEVLVTVAANRSNAYRYAISSASARGLLQFIPRTYAEMIRQYPKAHLKSDFVAGMSDHVNAAKASLVLFDWSLTYVSDATRTLMEKDKALLADYLAASYNGGATRASRSYGTGVSWLTLLHTETRTYVDTLRLAIKVLNIHW